MTGRVSRLAGADEAGSIRAEGGRNVPFEQSAVLAYDRDRLAVGNMVTFDLDDSTHPVAVNVVQMDSSRAAGSGQRHDKLDQLRYAGFEQSGNVRVFRFEQMNAGEGARVFLVAADLRLFTKHHVGLQEGPAMCLRLLKADSDPLDDVSPRSEQSLSDDDMLAHIARRAVLHARIAPKSRPRAPARQPDRANRD